MSSEVTGPTLQEELANSERVIAICQKQLQRLSRGLKVHRGEFGEVSNWSKKTFGVTVEIEAPAPPVEVELVEEDTLRESFKVKLYTRGLRNSNSVSVGKDARKNLRSDPETQVWIKPDPDAETVPEVPQVWIKSDPDPYLIPKFIKPDPDAADTIPEIDIKPDPDPDAHLIPKVVIKPDPDAYTIAPVVVIKCESDAELEQVEIKPDPDAEDNFILSEHEVITNSAYGVEECEELEQVKELPFFDPSTTSTSTSGGSRRRKQDLTAREYKRARPAPVEVEVVALEDEDDTPQLIQCGCSAVEDDSPKCVCVPIPIPAPTRTSCSSSVVTIKEEEGESVNHEHNKRYFCSWRGCNKLFLTRSGVATHELSHVGSKLAYRCRVCNATFDRETTRNKHARVHIVRVSSSHRLS